MPTDDDPQVEALLKHLKDVRGFDFTGYKRASLQRRIDRRMATVGIGSYEEYLDHLQVHPEEFTPLFDTILINVTSFFRDADAWAQLRTQVVPEILRDRGTEELRLWSAGCASGQEAYSLAILMAELIGADEVRRRRVKIYATDVDEAALAQARAGTYEVRQLEGLSEEQVAAHFEPIDEHFVLRKELRRSVIFGRNDLVQDAPISHIDLLLCRNTLMYFNAEVQSRILQRLHFALAPHGVLFLGKAEMLLSHSDLFPPRRPEPAVLAQGAERADHCRTGRSARVRRPGRSEPAGPRCGAARRSGPAAGPRPAAPTGGRQPRGRGPDGGTPERPRPTVPRPRGLLPPGRAALHPGRRLVESRTQWVREAEWHRAGGEELVLDVQVVPLPSPEGTLLGTTISFHDVTRYRRLRLELELTNRELEAAYETLQSTNEELETTNEELQSTVEELETTNEELQSTNEELETMNEELQSMNDELQATNDELRMRTNEVGDLNLFMASILTSLRSAVVVTDADLRVLVWNDQARELWGLTQAEVRGQQLLGLDIGLPLEQLVPTLQEALVTDGREPVGVDLTAINRRGHPVVIRVTASGLHDDRRDGARIVLVMEQVEEGGAPDGRGDASP